MTDIGIIGGSGLMSLTDIKVSSNTICETGYGRTSAPLVTGVYSDREIIFLARHGVPHTIPPHIVNYRANICALKDKGVSKIISVNAVGGITSIMKPGVIVIPDQIIDYTWSRQHTFFAEGLDQVVHVDFTNPYSAYLRERVISAASRINLKLIDHGTYGATQGPRLESAAEIKRMQQDGCNIVGMTGMPEAGLARELEIEYISICIVVNWAAGKSTEKITMEIIQENLDKGMRTINKLLSNTVKLL